MSAQPAAAGKERACGVELAATRFRLRARNRIAWLGSLAVGDRAGELNALLHDSDTPEAETRWLASQPATSQCNAELDGVEAALDQDDSSGLAQLRAVFGLAPREYDLLQACVAVALDPALGRLCAFLQNDSARAFLSEELIARLYGHGRCGVWSVDSALFRWDLVHARISSPSEPHALVLDTQVRDWLNGQRTLPGLLAGAAHLYEPADCILPPPVADLVDFIQTRLSAKPQGRVRIIIEGGHGSGRRTLAGEISSRMHLPMLVINADEIEERDWRRAYLLAQRHAFMETTSIAWTGECLVRRPWPAGLPAFPLQFAIIDHSVELPKLVGVTERRVRPPALTLEQRRLLWRSHMSQSQQWPENEFHDLAERYRVLPGDIVAAAASGATSAEQAGLRVREAARGRLGNLAQLLRCGFTWEDLVVAHPLRDVLEDIVYEARHRTAFWEQPEALRLFPQGQGLMALFSGPPGTGKTMAAQVVAATLGYDLFRVDLAGVVSKWVGETAQNFDRILKTAADMHAIILFDECDALFSKRTSEVRDAQDKFANTDAAHLLQAIESYPGVALLATNQKGNIDPAFIRRLRYVLEFARPDAQQRLELWNKLVGALAGEERRQALAGALAELAQSVETTGAQIKYATLGAMFAARRDQSVLELRHLLRGIERELAKEGRALGRDRERISRHGL